MYTVYLKLKLKPILDYAVPYCTGGAEYDIPIVDVLITVINNDLKNHS